MQVAGRVVVRLPITLRVQTLNTALMSHYLRSKLIGKKVTEGAQFITLYLGREEDFTVVSLEGVGMELEEQGEAKQQTMAYIVNNNTIIAFEEQQKELIL